MFKEALEVIQKTAVQAAGAQTKEIDPTKAWAIVAPNGTVEFTKPLPPWRRHAAKDLETIVAFAERFDGSAIWYSRERIVCLIDDADRRERCSVEMIHSDQIRKLAELEKAKPQLEQRAMLFMLRTVFTPESLPEFPNLIDTLRQVKFTANAANEANVQRGKSSVGKTLQVEASFVQTVPEQITLAVPVFDNSFARKTVNVRCALEIYEQEQRLQLFPLPGEIEKAYATAESNICGSISGLLGSESDVPVYYGDPK